VSLLWNTPGGTSPREFRPLELFLISGVVVKTAGDLEPESIAISGYRIGVR
jgi:hypothetical protein